MGSNLVTVGHKSPSHKGRRHFLPDLLSRREYPPEVATKIDESDFDEVILSLRGKNESPKNREFAVNTGTININIMRST